MILKNNIKFSTRLCFATKCMVVIRWSHLDKLRKFLTNSKNFLITATHKPSQIISTIPKASSTVLREDVKKIYINTTDASLLFYNFFNTIFEPLKQTLNQTKNNIVLTKTGLLAKRDPHWMLQKKLISFTYTQKGLNIKKKALLDFIQQKHPEVNKVYFIEHDDNISFTAIYEIHTGLKFGETNSRVHTVTFKTEHPPLRSVENQALGKKMTGQANPDLEVEFNSSIAGKFTSLYDILIGRNLHYKGNIAMVHLTDHDIIQRTTIRILKDLNHEKENLQKVLNKKELESFNNVLNKTHEIWNNAAITLPAKVLLIQELIIDVVPLVRKTNPVYNPNLIIFHEPAEEAPSSMLETLNKMEAKIPTTLNPSTPNVIVEEIVKQVLPIYLETNPPNLEVMAPKEREFCIEFIKRYVPDYPIF